MMSTILIPHSVSGLCIDVRSIGRERKFTRQLAPMSLPSKASRARGSNGSPSPSPWSPRT